MKRKITHGYVEQIFNDEGYLVEQKFTAGDQVEWENEELTSMADWAANDGYIHPMVCGSCLKLWMDNKPRKEDGKEEDLGLPVCLSTLYFGVRPCPSCIHAQGLDVPR